ncbi:hypothetical protein BK133_21315 [Paenibacillus sp. FSL H8-0548]|uniref:tyrosine-type recombinase/integrase n=1 Tax=Paenibacillus sp. FSL H8-0548 TaxID=1920422 RepID=UPI00096E46C4|nr:site-specific integrase [Paenibacillus sp. FSL H8-0548]OMF25633.1 hypothetical protein BK133_21315 [Paenibacillus sp. FSL H8-0548]
MKRTYDLTEKEQKIFENLERQVEKIYKHNRQGSYHTRNKYEAESKLFCKFLSKEFKLQAFKNIGDKHVLAYIRFMQTSDLSPSTIKDRLSIIRFTHDKVDQPKHRISSNSAFDLEKRTFGGVARAWSNNEYERFCALAIERGNDRITSIAILAKNEGLRIHETLKIDRSQAEKALQTNILTIKGKGGKIRDVPLSSESRRLLTDCIKEVDRGQKLFVERDEKTHLVIKQMQNWINRNRDQFKDQDLDKVNITFHGLRHAYAQAMYEALKDQGKSDIKAREEVSKLLGHERDDVTRIYLAR